MPQQKFEEKRFLSRNVLFENKDVSGIDCLIYSVGYETRSRFIVERSHLNPDRVLALVYSSDRCLSFEENLMYAEKHRFEMVSEDISEIATVSISFINRHRHSSKSISIGIDVSAMNRTAMSAFIGAIYRNLIEDDKIVFLYTPARFRQPNIPLLPLISAGPAHPSISGSISEPGRTRSLIMGLGYEYGISLSVIDRHEPDFCFIFKPVGFDIQYAAEVKEANFNFDFGDRNYEVIDYKLSDIARLYDDLAGLINSAKGFSDTIIVPLGPKIFSAVSIFCAYIFHPSIPVLRYSIKRTGHIVDVDSDGIVSGCEFTCIP